MSKAWIRLTGRTLIVLSVAALASLASSLGALASYDCRDSELPILSFRDLVTKSETIVLATAKTAEPAPFAQDDILTFVFDVDETLKGYQRKPLKIKARLHASNASDANVNKARDSLDDHRRMSFWDRMETGLVHVSSCDQALTFRLGGQYLLINPGKNLGPLSVAVEAIDNKTLDLWLKAVRRMTKDPEAQALTMTIDEYFKAQQSVVVTVMSYCNEKLRDGAFRVAEISDPLWGAPITRDGIDPEKFEDALEGCEGFTAMLGIFYQPDQSRPKNAPLGSVVYPGQNYVRLEGESLPLSKLRTEVTLLGPSTITLSDLIVALKGP
jgi:hypothetical protein